MILRFRHFLFSILVIAVTCVSGSSQDVSADAKIVADMSAKKFLRRAALQTCLKSASANEMKALVKEFWRPGVLDSFLSHAHAADSSRVEAKLCACPEFVRFLGALFSHPNRSQRLSAVAWSKHSTWPWLLRRRLRAFAVEEDPEVVAFHFEQITGKIKAEEMSAVWSKEGADSERLEAIFRLGLARAPGTQRVQAWPGALDWFQRGFATERKDAPFRRLVKSKILIPCPVAGDSKFLLLGIRRDSKQVRGLLTVFLKTEEIGKYAVGTGISLDQVIALRLPKSVSLIGEDLRLDLAPRLVNQVSFRALVAVEKNVTLGNPVASEQILGSSNLLGSFQVEKSLALTGGLVLKGKTGHLEVHMPKFDGRLSRVDLDHWADGKNPAVWNVSINGNPLVRLISQRLPRAAKCFPRNLALKPGRNELIFTRVSGGDLYIEAIRFVR